MAAVAFNCVKHYSFEFIKPTSVEKYAGVITFLALEILSPLSLKASFLSGAAVWGIGKLIHLYVNHKTAEKTRMLAQRREVNAIAEADRKAKVDLEEIQANFQLIKGFLLLDAITISEILKKTLEAPNYSQKTDLIKAFKFFKIEETSISNIWRAYPDLKDFEGRVISFKRFLTPAQISIYDYK